MNGQKKPYTTSMYLYELIIVMQNNTWRRPCVQMAFFFWASVCGSRWPLSEKTQRWFSERSIFFVLGEAIIWTVFLSPMDHVMHPHLPYFRYKTKRWWTTKGRCRSYSDSCQESRHTGRRGAQTLPYSFSAPQKCLITLYNKICFVKGCTNDYFHDQLTCRVFPRLIVWFVKWQ